MLAFGIFMLLYMVGITVLAGVMGRAIQYGMGEHPSSVRCVTRPTVDNDSQN